MKVKFGGPPIGRMLTHVGQYPDAALHRCLLAGQQPVAMVDAEHALQQLHEHGLACLQESWGQVSMGQVRRAVSMGESGWAMDRQLVWINL